MDNDRRIRLKSILLEQKRKMWNNLRDELFRKLGSEYNSQFDAPQDIEDLSVIDHLEDLGLTVTDIRRQEIERLDEAIRRLDSGAYGVCGRCGSDIEEDRLNAMPYAEHCLRCKQELESGERKKPTI